MTSARRPARRLAQGGLVWLAEHTNYYLGRGLQDRRDRVNHRAFLLDTRWSVSMNPVRNGTLELIARDVRDRQLAGAVAELGVYQGDFAALIGLHFPGRRLYLFDTFKGYDARDLTGDTAPARVEQFTETTAEIAQAKIPDPSRVVLCPGWFPASAEAHSDERFAFVHIDICVERPTAAGLAWFYPRLVPGGYLIVADYNTSATPGVHRAVEEFAAEAGIGYTPLPDRGGSAVFARPLDRPAAARTA